MKQKMTITKTGKKVGVVIEGIADDDIKATRQLFREAMRAVKTKHAKLDRRKKEK